MGLFLYFCWLLMVALVDLDWLPWAALLGIAAWALLSWGRRDR